MRDSKVMGTYEETSASDHEHCIGCVFKRCHKVEPPHGCPIIDCPLDCGMCYHSCKQKEHSEVHYLTKYMQIIPEMP